MIVVAGEALVDLIPTPAGDLGVNLGGGPFNTARWLGRPGADVGFLGSIAADPLGQRLRMGLLEAGVALDLVVATELPTTLAVALVIEPSATALARAVEGARGRGAVVMLDPNVRASLIGDRAAYLERLWGMLAQTDVLKLSVDDLAWLEPGSPPLAAARGLLELGPRVVLLTAGAGGATVVTAEAVTHVPAVAVDVVDAARFAADVASVACAQRGATPPALAAFPARFRTDGGTAAPTVG